MAIPYPLALHVADLYLHLYANQGHHAHIPVVHNSSLHWTLTTRIDFDYYSHSTLCGPLIKSRYTLYTPYPLWAWLASGMSARLEPLSETGTCFFMRLESCICKTRSRKCFMKKHQWDQLLNQACENMRQCCMQCNLIQSNPLRLKGLKPNSCALSTLVFCDAHASWVLLLTLDHAQAISECTHSNLYHLH